MEGSMEVVRKEEETSRHRQKMIMKSANDVRAMCHDKLEDSGAKGSGIKCADKGEP
jgi:hypothetical protein